MSDDFDRAQRSLAPPEAGAAATTVEDQHADVAYGHTEPSHEPEPEPEPDPEPEPEMEPEQAQTQDVKLRRGPDGFGLLLTADGTIASVDAESPAAQCDLAIGSQVIVAVEGTPVAGRGDVVRTLTALHKDEVTFTLASPPSPRSPALSSSAPQSAAALHSEVIEMKFGPEVGLGVHVTHGGILASVTAGSAAEQAGVTANHVIISANGTPVGIGMDVRAVVALLRVRPVTVAFSLVPFSSAVAIQSRYRGHHARYHREEVIHGIAVRQHVGDSGDSSVDVVFEEEGPLGLTFAEEPDGRKLLVDVNDSPASPNRQSAGKVERGQELLAVEGVPVERDAPLRDVLNGLSE